MRVFRSGVFAAALLGTSALASPALAQVVTPPPGFTSPDQNNVDLSTGLVWFSMEEGGIGSGPGRVSMQRVYAESARWVDNWSGGFYYVTSGGVTKVYVNFGGISNTFTSSGTSWVNDKGDGSSFVIDALGQPVYTAGDGTVITFRAVPSDIAKVYGTEQSCPGADDGTCQVPLAITTPSGLKYTLAYGLAQFCSIKPPGEPCAERKYFYRLSQVTSSAANQLNISYAGDVPNNTPPTLAWYQRTGVTFTNTVNPPATLPSVSYAYGTDTIDVTDPGGRTWRFTSSANGGMLNGIRRPGSTSDNISYTYGPDYTVTSATKDGVTDSYSFNASTGTTTRTDPASNHITVVTDLTKGRPTSYTNELGKTWGYQYDSNARLTRVTAPEGNYSQYAYDSRGNVTTVTNVAKSGSGLATSSPAPASMRPARTSSNATSPTRRPTGRATLPITPMTQPTAA
jgi:YD repeat-containing protein